MQADYTMHTDNACVLLAGKCHSLYMHKSLHNKILYNGTFVLPKQVLISFGSENTTWPVVHSTNNIGTKSHYVC